MTRMDRIITVTPKTSTKLVLDGINGSTSLFIWTTDSMHAVKASPGQINLKYRVHKLVDVAWKNGSTVVATAIVAPDIDYLEIMEKELRRMYLGGKGGRPRTYLYDWVEDEEGEDMEWEFEAGFRNPGVVVQKRIN